MQTQFNSHILGYFRLLLLNVGVKRSADELLQCLKPIAVALDKVQRDSCTIADAVNIWKTLESDLALTSRDTDKKQKFKKRIQQALSPYHYLANITHPRYRGKSLTTDEFDIGMNVVLTQHSTVVADIINLKAESSPFSRYMFEEAVTSSVHPVDWWKSQSDRLHADTLPLVIQLLTATASSAGVERVFSSMGLVHSKLRNRLGVLKAGKLAFLFKLLNKKTLQPEDEDDNCVTVSTAT